VRIEWTGLRDTGDWWGLVRGMITKDSAFT
jgi:hypothetical protein